MTKTLTFICILLLPSSLLGKVRVFNDFDFKQGGYTLVGVTSENSRNSLQDSLGDFYTDDIDVLNRFKQKWVFRKHGKNYACGYHYTIYLSHHGVTVLEMGINLDCNELAIGNSTYFFNTQLLKQFYGKLKPLYQTENSFTTLGQARDHLLHIRKDSNLIMTSAPLWIKFEGHFNITVTCHDNDQLIRCQDDAEMLSAAENMLRNAFPDEPFLIDISSSSLTASTFKIICNSSLAMWFCSSNDTKTIKADQWHPFDHFFLNAYWKSKPEMTGKEDPQSLNIPSETEKIRQLMTKVLEWGTTDEAIEVYPISPESGDSMHVWLNFSAINDNLITLRKSELFTEQFIQNYYNTLATIDQGMRSGTIEPTLIGDLPSFSMNPEYLDLNPWCRCQGFSEAQFDDPEIISMTATDATIKWRWTDDASWLDFRFKVTKENGQWKLDALEGFGWPEDVGE